MVNTSTILNNLKTKVDNLDDGKLKNVPIDMKRFAVQTLLWSMEFVIQINLEHYTIAVWNLARSWSISTKVNSLQKKIPDRATLIHINQYNS